MCKCTPEIRAPFCGKGDCVCPGSKKEGARMSEFDGDLDHAWEEYKNGLAPSSIYFMCAFKDGAA
jgi:hypothetical protein